MPRLHAPTIATERLVLDPITPGHAEEMAGVLADPGLYTHIGGRPPSTADLRRRYTAWAAGAPDPQVSWCNWAVRAGGRAVGTVQATVQEHPGRETRASLAWITGAPWQGRGYAAEAARALTAWLAGQDVRRIGAAVHPGNTASERIARACGMRPTGRWEEGERIWERRTAAP